MLRDDLEDFFKHTCCYDQAEIDELIARVWDEGFRTCDRVWTETSDLSTPDEDRTDPSNPYRRAKRVGDRAGERIMTRGLDKGE